MSGKNINFDDKKKKKKRKEKKEANFTKTKKYFR